MAKQAHVPKQTGNPTHPNKHAAPPQWNRQPRLTLRVVLPPVLAKQRHRPHVPPFQQLCSLGCATGEFGSDGLEHVIQRSSSSATTLKRKVQGMR